MAERKAPTERLKPLPYYRWYPTDYRASRNANRLDHVGRGIYRELLDECWAEGVIPDDIEALADIARCPVGIMAELWPAIRKMFRPTEGMDGMFLVNRRLEIERSESDQERIRKALGGRKGGLAKATNAKQNLAELSSASRPLASSSISSSEQSKAVAFSAPIDALALMARADALCPFCGGANGTHEPTCKPSRLRPEE